MKLLLIEDLFCRWVAIYLNERRKYTGMWEGAGFCAKFFYLLLTLTRCLQNLKGSKALLNPWYCWKMEYVDYIDGKHFPHTSFSSATLRELPWFYISIIK